MLGLIQVLSRGGENTLGLRGKQVGRSRGQPSPPLTPCAWGSEHWQMWWHCSIGRSSPLECLQPARQINAHLRAIFQLFHGVRGKKILRTSWRICVLYKHQELTNSSLWFSPPAFFFSPLISSHLSFSWPSSLWSTFKIILNWLHHFVNVNAYLQCSREEQKSLVFFCFFFGRNTKQQAWSIPSFGQRSGTHLDSYLPIVLEASINIGVRDLTQEENLSSVRKCICL